MAFTDRQEDKLLGLHSPERGPADGGSPHRKPEPMCEGSGLCPKWSVVWQAPLLIDFLRRKAVKGSSRSVPIPGGGSRSIPCTREVAGIAYDLPQHDVKAQTLVNAEAGLAQLGKSFLKRFYFCRKLLGTLLAAPHFVSRFELREEGTPDKRWCVSRRPRCGARPASPAPAYAAEQYCHNTAIETSLIAIHMAHDIR